MSIKQTIVYCYRMTHDYGINPCVFTENYEPTPDLLTEGGCMSRIRSGMNNQYKQKIKNKEVDVYLLAISGRSNDRGKAKEKRSRDERGEYISPEYEHLMFVAKISDIISRKEYLTSSLSMKRQDAAAYRAWWDNGGMDDKENLLISDKFAYFGKNPREIKKDVKAYFPKGVGHRKWILNENDMNNYGPLLFEIGKALGEKNHIEEPFHPEPIKTSKSSCKIDKSSYGKGKKSC